MTIRERRKVRIIQEQLSDALSDNLELKKLVRNLTDDKDVYYAEIVVLEREMEVQDHQIGLLGRTLAYEASQNMKMREGLLELEVPTGTITYKGHKK